MGEINSGLRSILKIPFFYDAYQSFVGVPRMRKYVIEKFFNYTKNCKVLDIGCAAGELLDFLRHEIHYTGFDKNEKCIELAKKRYTVRGNFICNDVNNMRELGLKENECDIILIFGVLHHLNDREVYETLNFANKLLKPEGYVLSVDGVYLEKQSKMAKYILSKDRGKHVRHDNLYRQLAEKHFSKIETFIEKNLLRIPTDYIVMKMHK